MKSLSAALFSIIFIAFSLSSCQSPFTIPEVSQWTKGSGEFKKFSKKIVICDGAEDFTTAAELLSSNLSLEGIGSFSIKDKSTSKGDIIIRKSSDFSLGEEGYILEIGDNITIESLSSKGCIWAVQTLTQMLRSSVDGTLAYGTIRDIPAYPLRGFMLDCGRKFFPMDYLKNLVKVMSYYKMNTLQIHLNDNGFKKFFDYDWDKTYAAFRMESDTYPGLTSKDGFYTKDEFREFIKESESLGVEIIPEIDVPAHALALTHYNKNIGSEEYGMDHLDLFKDETYEFLDALWDEYLSGDDPVFAGKRVHIGTDEYSNRDPKVVEQFRLFTDRYIKYVESYGKQACLWGALTHADGTTPVKSDNVVMDIWYNGYANPRDMKEQGYQIISIPDGWVYIVPGAGYYYDYLDDEDLYKNWAPNVIGSEVFEEKDPSILGGMFAVWNDIVGNGISVSDVHHRVMPAMQTIAAKCWSGSSVNTTFEDFSAKRSYIGEAPSVNELGIQDKLSIKNLKPNSNIGKGLIGYNYRVSFDIDAKPEEKGTVLLSCPRSTFYLSDPETGKLGFERDGYLITFDYSLTPADKASITIEGNNEHTILYVNGDLVEDLDVQTVEHNNNPKDKSYFYRTLAFPLDKCGEFNSKVSNFSAENI